MTVVYQMPAELSGFSPRTYLVERQAPPAQKRSRSSSGWALVLLLLCLMIEAIGCRINKHFLSIRTKSSNWQMEVMKFSRGVWGMIFHIKFGSWEFTWSLRRIMVWLSYGTARQACSSNLVQNIRWENKQSVKNEFYYKCMWILFLNLENVIISCNICLQHFHSIFYCVELVFLESCVMFWVDVFLP